MKLTKQYEICEKVYKNELKESELVIVEELEGDIKRVKMYKSNEVHERKNYENCGVITKDKEHWFRTRKTRRKKLNEEYIIYLMRFTELDSREVLKETIYERAKKSA